MAEETPNATAMFSQGFLASVYQENPVKPVLTRFPPEPNGFLHLGHAKAIAVNFGFAQYHGGKTNLRYDDTNPEAEEEKYFKSIEEIVRWLGFSPDAITYSSDNFDRLYEDAEKLISLEKAYVCHCSDVELKLQRGGEKGSSPRYRCEHAEQSVETNLAKFRDMRDGKYKPQAAFLRMKQDITSGNPQMWDLAAYRILENNHHVRTGDKWVIYPTYDFTHCLCDSYEGITHSLCTTEFIQARESYEWLNKSLGVYEPMQREYGRLGVSGTIMSKRKLKRLVDEGYVRAWDDPRLYTLIALRRRGIPPAAILTFIHELGVTTAHTTIQIKRFEQAVRKYLEMKVPRLNLVLDPIPVIIEDYETLPEEQRTLTIPLFPRNPEMGTRTVQLTKTVYIDRSDFREQDEKKYFRMAPGKTVGLLSAPLPVKATSFAKDADGKVTEIRAVFDREIAKPKAYIHWVQDGEGSHEIEVRVHDALFKSEDPDAAPGGFLEDINPNSETIYKNARLEPGFDVVRSRAPWPETEGEKEKHGPESIRFQGMRVAYFALDSDSTDDKLIFNRIVSLKEDSGKN